MHEVDDASFAEQVEQSSGAVLVDFWASWCAPCIALEPILAEVATERAEKLTVWRLNIQDAPRAVERYEVKTAPTLILFRDGRPVKRIFARRKRQLLDELDELL